VLGASATRLRAVATRHRWFISLLGGRPHAGPHALASYERLLAAVQRSIPALEDVLAAIRVVNAWAVGAIHMEANDLAAERATGLDERAWQESTWPWLEEQLKTGAFPVLSRVVYEVEHATNDQVFEHGLECVLDGVAARWSPPVRK
jgi:hypothetical protein